MGGNPLIGRPRVTFGFLVDGDCIPPTAHCDTQKRARLAKSTEGYSRADLEKRKKPFDSFPLRTGKAKGEGPVSSFSVGAFRTSFCFFSKTAASGIDAPLVMATNIPPHKNLRPRKKSWNCAISPNRNALSHAAKEIMQIVPRPDFPTGGGITSRGGEGQSKPPIVPGRGRLHHARRQKRAANREATQGPRKYRQSENPLISG